MLQPPSPHIRPSVPQLAGQLGAEIAARGLLPGDRFLTTEEAARHLKVRRDLANRALQVLVQRGLIERSQRIGARVVEPSQATRIFDRVHIVVQGNHPRVQTIPSPAFQVGLHGALPGCEIDVEQVSAEGAAAVLRGVLRKSTTEGLVLVRCDYPTQRLAQDCGLPAVLHGSAYAGIDLPSVDLDGEQMGRIQAQALIEKGSERLVVVRRDRALPGDRAFMTGFRSAAEERGFGCTRIDELELAPHPEVVAAEIALLFQQDAKLGIVCTARQLADALWTVARESGRLEGESFWLHGNRTGSAPSLPPYAYLSPREDDEAQGAELGRMLAERLVDPSCEASHHRVPCDLIPRTNS
ncbi:MAG: DNA-binding transcriptional regulator YhcF (GntR family) [Planctomycetota bacterium]|jgi:DNA-binding transcriptional regulator YhcF (GntR family)